MGGSTNVVLHSVEIARAAGLDLWADVAQPERLQRALATAAGARQHAAVGFYSMVDVDAKGGLQVNRQGAARRRPARRRRDHLHRETLAAQVRRLDPPAPDGDVIHPVAKPFKDTGGLRLLRGNLAPEGGAVLKIAGVEGGLADGAFRGRAPRLQQRARGDRGARVGARLVRRSRHGLIRYEGPRGAPGMPEAARSDVEDHSPVPAAQHHDRAHDGCALLWRIGRLVIGHVAPEAFLGGPIALIEDGDEIVVDINADRMDASRSTMPTSTRAAQRDGASRPMATAAFTRTWRQSAAAVLARMRATARPALQGAGMLPS